MALLCIQTGDVRRNLTQAFEHSLLPGEEGLIGTKELRSFRGLD